MAGSPWRATDGRRLIGTADVTATQTGVGVLPRSVAARDWLPPACRVSLPVETRLFAGQKPGALEGATDVLAAVPR
jgi:hypothetical protein